MKLTQADFENKDNHQWTAFRDGYSYVIRQIDGAFEVIIRPILEHDPTPMTWEEGLAICNYHAQNKRVANKHDADYKEFDEQ